MGQHTTCTTVTASNGLLRQGIIQGARVGLAGLLLMAGGRGVAQSAPAQSTPATPPSAPGRLTVRPHEMATGIQTAHAGRQTLDSFPDYVVYVPKHCVGAHRCPLVVYLHGGGRTPDVELQLHAPLAEKYGMIVLAPAAAGGIWETVDQYIGSITEGAVDASREIQELSDHPDVDNIDAALKYMLHHYAIDPDRIAIAGFSVGGAYADFLGSSNLDVFSRIAIMSPSFVMWGPGPENKAAQFFLSAGLVEPSYVLQEQFQNVERLRLHGYAVASWLGLRSHENRVEEFDRMWQWLQTSWRALTPTPAAGPSVSLDSLVALTQDVMTKMTEFWTRFMQEPDSIRTTGRLAHLKAVMVPVGREPWSVLMVDMAALAAQYPSVAADLKAAGMTAPQQEAYRIALISAYATTLVDSSVVGTLPATSPLAKNMAFVANSPALEALGATEMWRTP